MGLLYAYYAAGAFQGLQAEVGSISMVTGMLQTYFSERQSR
jgi:hypothetical protein